MIGLRDGTDPPRTVINGLINEHMHAARHSKDHRSPARSYFRAGLVRITGSRRLRTEGRHSRSAGAPGKGPGAKVKDASGH